MTRHAMDCATACVASCPPAPCDCGAEPGCYRVLKPVFEKTGESFTDADGRVVFWWRVKGWQDIGSANSMKEAIQRYPRNKMNGYAPVLEYAGQPH